MRVLHVIDVLTLGGGQALALRVIEGLQQRNIECALSVLLTQKRTHPIWRLPVDPVYLEFQGDYRRPLRWNRCVRQLQRVMEEFRPDVVHSYNWLADVTAARACRTAGVPHVAYLVDRRSWLTSGALKHRLRRWQTRSSFRGAKTRFMAVSGAVADFVAEHLPVERESIDVVHNSIDIAPFAEIASRRQPTALGQQVTIGMLSQLKIEKGHRVFLDAVEELVRREVPLRVLIGGEGPLLEEISHRAAQPVLRDCVSVVGLVDDAKSFYQQCDVFVVPSIHSEGLPTTILEAMASGCAVVASDVGGAREAIRDQIEGLLVPANNPTALADALEAIIMNQEQRVGFARAGAERVARDFDVAQMLDRIVAVYASAGVDKETIAAELEQSCEVA